MTEQTQSVPLPGGDAGAISTWRHLVPGLFPTARPGQKPGQTHRLQSSVSCHVGDRGEETGRDRTGPGGSDVAAGCIFLVTFKFRRFLHLSLSSFISYSCSVTSRSLVLLPIRAVLCQARTAFVFGDSATIFDVNHPSTTAVSKRVSSSIGAPAVPTPSHLPPLHPAFHGYVTALYPIPRQLICPSIIHRHFA